MKTARIGVSILGGLAITAGIATTAVPAHASSTFAVGVPTIVDPVRAVGEPDITVDNNNNALINGPGGSSTATSFFWRSRDAGLTYSLLGPSGGHWICPASGGGDALSVIDRATNDIYLTDQESLANLGSGKLTTNNTITSQCATAPAMTADRPFEGVLNTGNTTAPQSIADLSKPIVYLSWLCQGCAGSGNSAGGGLAFGWTDDGVTFHPAEPGVTGNNLATNNFQEATTINNFQWHGPTVVDPVTGYVYTGLSCNGGGNCPNGANDNQFGVAIGKPFANPTVSDPTNVGQFQSLTYQTAVPNAADPGSLFPVLTMDSARTLYLLWTQGDGAASTTATPDATSWHIYYSYSPVASDGSHPTWSAPIQVDSGPQTATSAMGWVVAGDAGHLGFIWLGTSAREHPSKANTSKQWFPFMAVTTNGNTATPTFQQTQVGIGPNHIGDVCLQGTVGCITSVGNRNMADFISVDIGPNGQLQGTWANDSNQLHTDPSTLIPGLPLTESAVQVSGPQLIGGGTVSDSRFSTVPTTSGIGDLTGDGLYPVFTGGANVAQLDLTNSRIEWDGTNILVHISAANLASMLSPDLANQNQVWWLTTWQFNHKIYFAKAQSIAGQAPVCTAGLPKSFDRPGLNGQTVATLVDYGATTLAPTASAFTVSCTKTGNEFVITVPPSDVGSPIAGSVLEAVTGFSVLDNGAPPCLIGPNVGTPAACDNIPTITDATPAYNAVLAPAEQTSVPEAPAVSALAGLGLLAAVAGGYLARRRRNRQEG